MTDHYSTIGVPRDATTEEIKGAYRKAARENHPDRAGGDAEKMAAANRAYAVLSDPAKREHYDVHGEETVIDIPTKMLMEVLREHLLDEDTVASARVSLKDALLDTADGVRALNQRIKHLEARRGKIKAKGTVNLAHQLIDKDIALSKQRLEQGELGRKNIAAALKLLDDYEDVGPEPAAVMKPASPWLSSYFYGTKP